MLDGAIEALFEGINGALRALIEQILAQIMSFLTGAFDTSGANDLSAGGLIASNPITWNAGGGAGTTIWQNIHTVSDNAIVPIALLVFMVVIITDLVQMMIAGNNFGEATIGAYFKWFIKTCVGLLLISNVFNIASGIFSLGVYAGEQGLASFTLTMTTNMNVVVPATDPTLTLQQQTGVLLLVMIVALLTLLAAFVLTVAIIVVLAGRMIEVFMYLSIAPLAAATFINQEWKGMGHDWLRGMFGLAFQAFFMVIALTIFSVMFGSVLGTMNTATGSYAALLARMATLFAFSLAMVMTIFRSGSISKAVFGAR